MAADTPFITGQVTSCEPHMRFQRLLARVQSTPLLLALVVWLCTVPLLLLLGGWLLSWPATVTVIVLVLLAELVACWLICRTPRLRSSDSGGG